MISKSLSAHKALYKNMKYIILFFTLIILCVVIHALFIINQTRRVGGEVVKQSLAYEQNPEEAIKKVLFLGDSLAFGVGADKPEGSLAGRVGTAHPNWDITNDSKSGRRIAGQLAQLRNNTFETQDLLILQIGGNDVVYLTDVSQVQKDLDVLLVEAKKISDEVIFLSYGDVGLVPGMPPIVSWFHHKRSLLLRDIFITAAEKHGIHYVDLYEGPGKDAFGADIERYYSPDKFHPSSEGYGLWYSKLEPVVAEVMK